MSTATTSNDKLHEALALLNEAAKEKRGEVQKMIGERYTHVKSVLGEVSHESAAWLKEKGAEAADTAKQAAATVDESAHKHPWPWIGCAAFGALILGLMLGRRR